MTPSVRLRTGQRIERTEIVDTKVEFSRRPSGSSIVSDTRQDRDALFANLHSPQTQPKFWARVSDTVDWTVEGTHPLAGRYHTKSDFLAATFARLDGVLVGGVRLEVQHLYIDTDTTIVEL